jgi:predicted transcriptional regulator
MSNEVMERYRRREISAVDVAVYSALCSLRRELDGVRVGQKRLAIMCGITEKTVSVSVFRLYSCGLIVNVITEEVKHWKKYRTSIYQLKSLPESGYFFVPRCIFCHTGVSAKMFAMYIFMCKSRHFEYEKSWNSYNDICVKLGFGKGQRSEVMRLISGLVKCGLLKKTVRRVKGVFVDNIYRVAGFSEFSFLYEGVGCDFTDYYITHKGIYENYRSEKKNSGLREITTDDNIFVGVQLLL